MIPEKFFYIYQHFQDSKKVHQIEPESDLLTTDDDSLYSYVNNDIEYGLFEDLVESYYLDRLKTIFNATKTVTHNIGN